MKHLVNPKPLAALYHRSLRPFRVVRTEVDGWTVTLNVMREEPRAGKVAYIAVLTTGEEEVGTHIAVMDRQFEFPEDYRNVMNTIRLSMAKDRAVERLLEDAVEHLRGMQRQSMQGQFLLS